MESIETGRIVCAALYVIAGILHFAIPRFYLAMMPAWIPGHRFCVYASGAAEIILGAGLLVEETKVFAAWGIVLLLLAVFPANLHMFQNPEKFRSAPRAMLALRLPLQGALIYWALLYTEVFATATNAVASI